MSAINLGLERVQRLMSLLPRYTRPTVHVAGTNGKGSVTTMVESVLREAGFSTGRFNSPHLVEVWDSIKLDTRSVSEEHYTAVRQKIQKLNDEHSVQASPFELHTISALSLFQDLGVDVVVLEVGMGGLTDATNVISDESVAVSAITAIDYDHQGFLGNTIQQIASHKVGIVRPNGICVLGHQNWPDAASTVRTKVKSINAELIHVPAAIGRPYTISPSSPYQLQPCTVSLPFRGGTLQASIPLHGQHQLVNVSTAVAALDALRTHPSCTSRFPIFRSISDENIAEGLSKAQWPGRLSWHTLPSLNGEGRPLTLLVDGAHNAASAQALASYLAPLPRPVFVLALSHSPAKPPAVTLSPLIQPGDQVIATVFSAVRDMPWVQPVDPQEIVKTAKDLAGLEGSVHMAENLDDALVMAGGLLGEEEYIVVAGSLYLVADFYRGKAM